MPLSPGRNHECRPSNYRTSKGPDPPPYDQKALADCLSSFYCLRVLRIGDPKTETACVGHRKSHIAECNYCGEVDSDIGGHSGRGQGGRDDGGSVMVTGVVTVMETLKS